jgi:uncharacterized protein
MKQRILGFDLARAYAIFGMFVVNFNFCFGSFRNQTPLGGFLNLFTGNSTAIFILCAGMGVSLMSNRTHYTSEEKAKLKTTILKRSWFLFGLGLLLYNWWPGDILHFYGGYMHVAAFLLFVPKQYFLYIAGLAILIFHLLLLLIPIETSWNLDTFQYADFWSLTGFLRNTFYNGWNSIFPWLAYFMVGMSLGKLDWQQKKTKTTVFGVGLGLLIIIKIVRIVFKTDFYNPDFNWFYDKYWSYVISDYFPPYLPFMLITTGFALMVIAICMFLGEQFAENKLTKILAKTGQMTLSHYVIHLTIGMVILATLTNKHYSGYLEDETPTEPIYILGYSLLFFVWSVLFSYLWSKRFMNGPMETLMRHFSGFL